MTTPEPTDPCPCGSGKAWGDCCGPIVAGQRAAATAADLMRARYAAYATVSVDFLYQSSGPEIRKDFSEKEARAWAENSEWQGIDILAAEGGGPDDDEGTVEFVAHYSARGKHFSHHERSLFRRIDGAWRFVDGRIVHETYRRETPKIGRNDPCPCGSGKKYKHCCGR